MHGNGNCSALGGIQIKHSGKETRHNNPEQHLEVVGKNDDAQICEPEAKTGFERTLSQEPGIEKRHLWIRQP